MQAPDRFTIVVAPTNAEALEAIRRYARLGDTVQFAGVQASIEAACFGSAIDQLTTTEKRLEELSLGITPPTPLSHGERLLLSLSIALANQSRTAAEVAEARERLDAAHKAERVARECADKMGAEVIAHAEQLSKAGADGLASPAPVDADRVNQIATRLENVNQPAEFDVDEHARMALDAQRYRFLRDRQPKDIEDPDHELLVSMGNSFFTGGELDYEVDTALRLQRLEQREDESCTH